MEERFISKTTEETKKIASNLARQISKGSIVLLSGDLGAGKTVFAKGFAEGLGIISSVPSPTFTIMNIYDNLLYHFDLYRLNGFNEFLATGAEEYLYSDGYSLIEWPECVGVENFPENAIKVKIHKIDDTQREIVISRG